eukprot:UN19777
MTGMARKSCCAQSCIETPRMKQRGTILAVTQENNAIKNPPKESLKRGRWKKLNLQFKISVKALATFKRLAETGLAARKSRCLKHAEWCKKTLHAGDESFEMAR